MSEYEQAGTTAQTDMVGLWATIREAVRGSQRDFTEGSIRKAIFLLAVPMVMEMAMESVFAVVDVFFVSKLGPDAAAAVGITESMILLVAQRNCRIDLPQGGSNTACDGLHRKARPHNQIHSRCVAALRDRKVHLHARLLFKGAVPHVSDHPHDSQLILPAQDDLPDCAEKHQKRRAKPPADLFLQASQPGTESLPTLKIAVLAPMPSASVMMAMTAKPGFFTSIRTPNLMSCQRVSIIHLTCPAPSSTRDRETNDVVSPQCC
jgi:hypothetical protein